MHKRGRNLHIKGAAVSEIFVLVLATVAFAFVLGEANLTSAADVTKVSASASRGVWTDMTTGKKVYYLSDGKTVYRWDQTNWVKSTSLSSDPGWLADPKSPFVLVQTDYTGSNIVDNPFLVVAPTAPPAAITPTGATLATQEIASMNADILKAQAEIDKINTQLGQATKLTPDQIDAANSRIAELNSQIAGLEAKNADAVNTLNNANAPPTQPRQVYEMEGSKNVADLGEANQPVPGQPTAPSARITLSGTVADGEWIKQGNGEWTSLTHKGYTLTDNDIKELTAVPAAGPEKDVTPSSSDYTGWPGAGNFGKALGEGLKAGAAAYVAAKTILPGLGFTDQQTIVISNALLAGITVGRTAASFWKADSKTNAPMYIGIAVTALIILTQYKNEKEKTITFTCMPWEAPVGGANCLKCNGDKFRPCTEYRCKALGGACELLNKDKPGSELCAAVDRNDATSPTIAPAVNALYPIGLSYISDTSVRPPALGVRIVEAGGSCLKAYTPLKFGINTNEPAICKIDTNLNNTKFDNMQYYMGGDSGYAYNHTESMRLPSPSALGEDAGILLQNGDTMQMFIRCRDRNGNENVDGYSVKFCVDKSPDTTPPTIEGTSIPTGNPVRFGILETPIDVYTNELAECRWSIESKGYDNMENIMDCNQPAIVRNAMPTYVCTTNITSIKDRQDNKYYIRCKDQPGEEENKRNVMVQSYELVLKGTQPLNIIDVMPNETVTGATGAVNVSLEVETDDGAEEGKATCYFSPIKNNDTFVQMFETDSFKHKQMLLLTTGVYTYYFRCVDLGGNAVDSQTTFAVYSDTNPPKVTRVYKEEGTGLKVVTNEDAECRYALKDCNFVFNEGLSLVYSNPNIKTNSYAEWKPNTVYYIKCRDMYGNEPNPNECSVVAKPIESGIAKA